MDDDLEPVGMCLDQRCHRPVGKIQVAFPGLTPQSLLAEPCLEPGAGEVEMSSCRQEGRALGGSQPAHGGTRRAGLEGSSRNRDVILGLGGENTGHVIAVGEPVQDHDRLVHTALVDHLAALREWGVGDTRPDSSVGLPLEFGWPGKRRPPFAGIEVRKPVRRCDRCVNTLERADRDVIRTFKRAIRLVARGRFDEHECKTHQSGQASRRGDLHGLLPPYLECRATRLPSLSSTTARKPWGPI